MMTEVIQDETNSNIKKHSLTIEHLCKDINVDVEKFIEWVTTTPLYTTFRVNTFKTSVDHIVKLITDQLQKQTDVRKHSVYPKVVQDDILKDCIVIDSWLTAGCKLSASKDCENSDYEVIIDIPCGVAVLRGAHIFVPGVMSLSPGAKEGDLVNIYVDISKKCLKGLIKNYDDQLKKFIGCGVVKINRKALFEANKHQSGVAVEVMETISGVPSLVFPSDLGLLQNYPSILCSHVLDPTDTDLVLDMCASPGNKTSHLAALMSGKGQVIAIDKTANKIKRLEQNCEKQQLNNVKAYVYDSTKALIDDCLKTDNDSNYVVGGPPYHESTFDRILLDAPCSALGQRPQLELLSYDKQLGTYPIIQRKLFNVAVQLLKPDGVLVYSTCTLSVDENERMVAWVLKQFPQIHLVPAEPIVGSPGNINCGLSDEHCLLVQKFGPTNCKITSHLTDTVGFFVAKFKKSK